MNAQALPHQVRAIFISDVHLGTRACQADRLLDFLRDYESEYLYLVGDIADFWAMRRSIYWSGAHNTVVQKILKRARHGTQVVLVPGNHDELLRDHLGQTFGEIRILDNPVHTTAVGARLLILHGDAFDQVTRYHRWIARLGDGGYSFLMRFTGWFSWWRRLLGSTGGWSLSGYVKTHLKSALVYIDHYEKAVAEFAQLQGYDGVVCGHIHVAADKVIAGVRYLNCGDWVDSCTALVEATDGRMNVVRWSPTSGADASKHSSGRVSRAA